MIIFERNTYEVPPEVLWDYVVDPARFVLWNKKLKIFSYTGPFREGDSFSVEYSLSGRKTACRTTVFRVKERSLLHLTHSQCLSAEGNPDMEAEETFVLKRRGGRTFMRHKVWIRKHNIPFYLVALITFVSYFGETHGSDDLELLLKRDLASRS